MRRSKVFLNSILGIVIGAGACAESPTAPPMAQQGRVLPALSLFKVSSAPAASWGHDDDNNSGPGSATTIGSLVGCTPLHRDDEHKDIGIGGGYLNIGPHTLVIPAGALTKKTRITATIVGDNVNSLKFQPEGLQFLVPTYLFMSYANCTRNSANTLEVIYTNDDLTQLLQNLPSFDDLPNYTVVALVSHFSIYAVAY